MPLFTERAHAAALDIALTPSSLAFTYQIDGTAHPIVVGRDRCCQARTALIIPVRNPA
jgi:hypothetical protein